MNVTLNNYDKEAVTKKTPKHEILKPIYSKVYFLFALVTGTYLMCIQNNVKYYTIYIYVSDGSFCNILHFNMYNKRGGL